MITELNFTECRPTRIFYLFVSNVKILKLIINLDIA